MSCCNIVIPIGSSRIGHCSKCCITFWGDTAFDAHLRSRDFEGRATHIDPAQDDKRPWWQDDRGFWHYGVRGENPWARDAE